MIDAAVSSEFAKFGIPGLALFVFLAIFHNKLHFKTSILSGRASALLGLAVLVLTAVVVVTALVVFKDTKLSSHSSEDLRKTVKLHKGEVALNHVDRAAMTYGNISRTINTYNHYLPWSSLESSYSELIDLEESSRKLSTLLVVDKMEQVPLLVEEVGRMAIADSRDLKQIEINQEKAEEYLYTAYRAFLRRADVNEQQSDVNDEMLFANAMFGLTSSLGSMMFHQNIVYQRLSYTKHNLEEIKGAITWFLTSDPIPNHQPVHWSGVAKILMPEKLLNIDTPECELFRRLLLDKKTILKKTVDSNATDINEFYTGAMGFCMEHIDDSKKK